MTFARIRALVIVGVLFVAAVVLVTISIVGDKQTKPVGAACPKNAVRANTRLADAENIQLNVYNASDIANQAHEIALELQQRKFKVDPDKAANDPLGKPVKGGVAALRFGPKSIGAAWVVNAYFLNAADMQFDINRQDEAVDIVLGPSFKKLATQTEEKQALAQAGRAHAYPGTCDTSADQP